MYKFNVVQYRAYDEQPYPSIKLLGENLPIEEAVEVFNTWKHRIGSWGDTTTYIKIEMNTLELEG